MIRPTWTTERPHVHVRKGQEATKEAPEPGPCVTSDRDPTSLGTVQSLGWTAIGDGHWICAERRCVHILEKTLPLGPLCCPDPRDVPGGTCSTFSRAHGVLSPVVRSAPR